MKWSIAIAGCTWLSACCINPTSEIETTGGSSGGSTKGGSISGGTTGLTPSLPRHRSRLAPRHLLAYVLA